MTFDNALLEVTTNEANIINAFDNAFQDWKFNIDKIEEVKALDSKTKVNCHFLQRSGFDPVLNIEVAAYVDTIT